VRVALGADHGGFELKEEIKELLNNTGKEVIDVGAHCYDPDDDFPDSAIAVARQVAQGKAERGIIICGSGVGACVAANKIKGIRASVCHDLYSASQGVEHDNMNVLCLGGRIVDPELARELVSAFLNANYINEGKYKRRVDKILKLEEELK
jgi:ribose 5-phosphate isomerase B